MHKYTYVWVVFHINGIHIMLQLAFCPSTIFFEISPITLYLVHSFELLYRVLCHINVPFSITQPAFCWGHAVSSFSLWQAVLPWQPWPAFFFFFFFFKIFLMWTIFKVFIEFVTTLLLFYVLVYGHEACGILAPRPGIEPTPPALEGKVLTTEPPGKSLDLHSWACEPVFLQGKHQEMDRWCHCFFKRAAWSLTLRKLLEGCVGLICICIARVQHRACWLVTACHVWGSWFSLQLFTSPSLGLSLLASRSFQR